MVDLPWYTCLPWLVTMVDTCLPSLLTWLLTMVAAAGMVALLTSLLTMVAAAGMVAVGMVACWYRCCWRWTAHQHHYSYA